jgi:hypothetical protein
MTKIRRGKPKVPRGRPARARIGGSPDSIDLTTDVTVFVTTVGVPSFPDCIERQDCRFRLRVIERVAPMSAAFQAMLDQCDTPYYVRPPP